MSYWYTENVIVADYNGKHEEEKRHEVEPNDPRATLEGSRIRYTKRHMPQLDLDVPHSYNSSSTQGHGHLHITGLSLSWRKYKRLLRALYRAGVIQKGYYTFAKQNKQSFLRLPHIKKSNQTRAV